MNMKTACWFLKEASQPFKTISKEKRMNENIMRAVSARIAKLYDRLHPSESVILLVTAAIVGAGTGLGAVIFIKLIGLVQNVIFKDGASTLVFLGGGLIILAPMVGGLLAGPIISFFAKEAKGHGVPEVMQAIALRGGRIRPRIVVAKVIASALCIGSGGSAGREGPIVQVGSALGSTIGQWLHLPDMRIRNLVACGAAAGIAATFNAPIAGAVFAMEIILGELHMRDMGNVIIAAVTASTVARVFLGDSPAFSIPSYSMKTPWEILLYIVLGIIAGLAAVGFIRLLYGFEDIFDNWHFPEALKPAVGGLLLGGLAFLYPLALRLPQADLSSGSLPAIFGTGFTTIENALTGKLPLLLLLILVILKPLATSLTLGSGNSGGVFAPSLCLGAVLGGAFGWVANYFFPGSIAGPGAFAVVGMAAVFAGAAHAPFTAILIVFEMTNDYRLILPLMAGVIVSLIISERVHPESIYTLKLVKRGIHLKTGQDVDVMETVRVDEVMETQPITVSINMPVTQLAEKLLLTGHHGFLVLDDAGDLFGNVSLEDYRLLANKGSSSFEQLLVKDIASRDIVSIYPDETVGMALRRMAPRDLSRLPVVTRDNPRRLVGIIRRSHIIQAHEMGVVRRDEARRRATEVQLVSDSLAEFIDIPLPPGANAVGKRIAELNLPRTATLVSIRRDQQLLIPHGDARLQVGDVVTALSKNDSLVALKSALTDPPDESEQDGDRVP
jgi:CIC family chloride channel protein